MPPAKKPARVPLPALAGNFFAALKRFDDFAQLNAKIARARNQDPPIVYADVLPGIDLLICKIRGAQPPYPPDRSLRHACLESLANALEQPATGLEQGGYWYEHGGLGMLVFASHARDTILAEFGGGPSLRAGDLSH
jgi:hypothetical protein